MGRRGGSESVHGGGVYYAGRGNCLLFSREVDCKKKACPIPAVPLARSGPLRTCACHTQHTHRAHNKVWRQPWRPTGLTKANDSCNVFADWIIRVT